jgi:transglutaminase-like putative cysteine protease
MRIIFVPAALLALALVNPRPVFAQVASDEPIRFEAVTADIDLQADGRYVEINEQQFKLQTQSAVQQASQMVFGYNASMQRLAVLQAYTQKADGRKVDVKKEAIFTRDLPASAGAPTFDDVKVVMVVFPEVAVGDSVYARVRTEQTEPMFPGHYSNLFCITPHLVIDRYRVTLRVPDGMPLRIENEGYAQTRTERDGNVTYEWTAQQTTTERLEAGSISALDYSRRLSLSTFPSFADFAVAYGARATDKAQVAPAIQELADRLTAGVPAENTREQARRLYDWVSQNIRYVGIFLGSGAVVPHAADLVLANRYGDCKDHVTLLTALLAAKNISAETAIVNAGNSFWIGKLPLLSNFNHVIAYLPAVDLFLDPTSSVAFGRLPSALQGKTVVIVPTGELKSTPADKNTDNLTTRHVTLAIEDDGSINGTTVIEARGARAETYRELARNLTAQEMKEFVRDMTTGSRFKGEGTVEFTGTDDRTGAMTVTAKYTLRGGIDWPGSGSFEVPAGFYGGEYMSSQVGRNNAALKHPAFRGYAETLVEEYDIRLPATMNVIAVPQNVNLKNDVASYSATFTMQGQTLRVTRKLVDRLEGPVIAPTLFKAADEKSDAIARDLRAQIVYRAR